jgi:hypothetical protein
VPEANINIRGTSDSKLRIEPTDVKGEGGPLYPRLIVPLQIDFKFTGTGQQDQAFTLLTIEGGLFTKDNERFSDASPNTSPYVVRSLSGGMTWRLVFPLDPYRLNGIEARRLGDLNLRLDLFLILAHHIRVVVADKVGPSSSEVIGTFEKPNSQIYLQIPQSHWVGKILPDLGANKYFLVEIPTQTDSLVRAWALIDQAEDAYRRWDTKAVYAHCREAVTALSDLVKTHHSQNSFLTEQRWHRAAKEFNHFASLDLHLEEIRAKGGHAPNQVRIEKADAECLLIIAKALAKYAGELIDS